MSRLDEEIERLIVRRLDGQLSDEEQLRLDRELMRDPEARRMLDEYGRIDELAASALRAVTGDEQVAFDASPSSAARRRSPHARRYSAERWLVPGAVAAALLAIVAARFPASWNPRTRTEIAIAPPPVSQPSIESNSPPADLMRTVGDGGTRIKRDTGREFFGVFGEDGNLYWIEVDRTRTVRQPKGGSAVRFTSDEM